MGLPGLQGREKPRKNNILGVWGQDRLTLATEFQSKKVVVQCHKTVPPHVKGEGKQLYERVRLFAERRRKKKGDESHQNTREISQT